MRHVHELARTDNIGVLWATHLFDEVEPDDDLLVLNAGQHRGARHGQGRGGGDRRQAISAAPSRLLIGGDTEEDVTA